MRFVVLGDLHLDVQQDATFARAREQICALEPEGIVCLGDLGSGRSSGTRSSFEDGRDWLDAFGLPYGVVLGNHDLERIEAFASDEEVVRCFCDVFARALPYGTLDLGPALGVLLSSTGFRNNRGDRHEVSIDDAQFAWFRSILEAHRERPIVVFSHAPPLGSRLQVLQYPHLRAGNAWLNQSDRPRRFFELLEEHPQVRLWFSAHNHLGQSHARSVSHVGRCLFVHTGVIGEATRDGCRHSRVVTWRGDEVRVDSLDHATGQCVEDVTFSLTPNALERRDPMEPPSSEPYFAAPEFEQIEAGPETHALGRSALVAHRDMLVEYDRGLRDPIGVVEDWLGRSRVRTECEELVLASWLGRRQVASNRDGYYFRVPSRDPRLLAEVREAIFRRLGRRAW